MSLLTLILREIRHRWGMFLLGAMSIAAAVAVVVIAAMLLERDRIETSRLLAEKQRTVEARVAKRQAEVEQSGAELQDAIRKHMTKLGFNVLIVPESQDLGELHLSGTLTETMPEAYVNKLSESGVVTVNHLLPMVTRRMNWPEQNAEVILVGTRGEVPILHRSEKKPLLNAVAPGEMVVGYEVHQKLGCKAGDTIRFLEREFKVATLHPQRGTTDDVTVWIDLAAAQEMLGLQNLIHGILALECECAGDRIAQVRAEIQSLLPGTQVVERYSQALARAEARTQAQTTATQALAAEQAAGRQLLEREVAARRDLESQREALVRWLVPAVIAAAAAWIAALAYVNVRQRREEIGILRAIGLRRTGILAVFEGKSVLMGFVGGVTGAAMALGYARTSFDVASLFAEVFSAPGIRSLVVLAPLAAAGLAALASWLPALIAANHDPALVLEGN